MCDCGAICELSCSNIFTCNSRIVREHLGLDKKVAPAEDTPEKNSEVSEDTDATNEQ